MDRTTSLLRRTYVFGGVALVALAALVLRPASSVESVANERLAPTFPGFEPSKARVLEFERSFLKDGEKVKESVRLVRAATGAWAVESAWAYPADGKRIDDFLKSLTGVRTQSTPTTNPEKFKSFADADGYTDVRVLGDGDAPVLSFGIGRGGAEGSYQSLYLRVDDLAKGGLPSSPQGPDAKPAAGRVVAATGLDAYGNRTSPTGWVETRIWPGLSEREVSELSIVQLASGKTITLVRDEKASKSDDKGDKAAEKDAPETWTLTSPTKEKADAASARQATSAFVGMLFAAIEDGVPATPEIDAKRGFDKPELVLTAKGKAAKAGDPVPVWTLTVGKKNEAKATVYVRRSSGKAEPWTFTVNDFDLTHFRDEPGRYQDKKPEPPAAPAMAEEAPAMGETPAMGEPPAMGETPPAPPPTTPAMDGAAPAPAMDGTPPAPPAMGESPPPAPEAPPAPPAMGDAPPPGPAGMGEPPPPK